MSTKIGRFEIIGELGRGGFGMVYKGQDPLINRLAAIKVMSAQSVQNPEMVARFKREAEAAGGLNHRNIVTIYDLGEHDGLPYIAMEFLEGKDLDQLLREGVPMTIDQKVDILAQVAEGLHYAHGRGVIHRDIKPSNIRVLIDGTVKLMDFGIAKLQNVDLTKQGQFMGTIHYMSPEQIKGKKVEPRSDIFSLGVVFYEILSRRRPFSDENVTAVMFKILNETPAALEEIRTPADQWLEPIVLKCLEKDPARRWESAQELAEALRQRKKLPILLGETTAEFTVDLNAREFDDVSLESALKRMDELLRKSPNDEIALRQKRAILTLRAVRQSAALVTAGRLEQARDELSRTLQEVGESQELTRSLADVETRIKTKKADQLLEVAERHLAEKRFEPAIDALERSQELDVYNEKVHGTLARARDEKRKHDVDELVAAARRLHERGQIADARARLVEAVGLDPHAREPRRLLQTVDQEFETTRIRSEIQDLLLQARAALKKEEPDKAIELVNRSLALDAKNAEAAALLGEAKSDKMKAGEHHLVLDLVRQGEESLRRRQLDQAVTAFHKALRLDPDWVPAKRGIEAATRQGGSARAARTAPSRGVQAGLAAAGAIVLAVLAYVVFRPSESTRALRAGDRAVAAGRLAEARQFYEAAAERAARDEERRAATTKLKDLYGLLAKDGNLVEAKQVVDALAKRPEAESLRPQYAELAGAFSARAQAEQSAALFEASSSNYREYFRSGYDRSADFEIINAYDKLGEAALTAADDAQVDVKSRLGLYALAQEVLTFVDTKEASIASAYRLAAEARLKRGELSALAERATSLAAQIDAEIKKAAELETGAKDTDAAIQSYRNVLKLVAQNQDLTAVIDLNASQARATQAIAALETSLASAADAAGKADKAKILLDQATRMEAASDLNGARRQYEELSKLDPDDTAARKKMAELDYKLARFEAITGELQAALRAKDLAAADAKLKDGLALAPGDSRLAALGAELERLRQGAAEAARVEGDLGAADALLAAGKDDAAESRYDAVARSTSDRSVLARASRGIEQARLKKRQAALQPKLEAAQALEKKGDRQGALTAWKEVERIDSSYPGLEQKFAALSQALNHERIAAAERELQQAFKTADQAAFERTAAGLRELDPSNAVLADLQRRQQARTATPAPLAPATPVATPAREASPPEIVPPAKPVEHTVEAPKADLAADGSATPAIQQALSRYQDAFGRKDAAAIQAVWPSLSGDALNKIKQSFQVTRSMEVVLTCDDPKLTGERAVLSCQRRVKMITVDGQTNKSETKVSASLVKQGSAWVIENIR